MATAEFFVYAKRHNSTSLPTVAGTQYDVTLKGGSDMYAPVLVLNYSGFPVYNYLKFNNFYYFVVGVKNIRQDLWEISCDIDVLGTFRHYIRNTLAYVLYYTHANTEIADRRLSVKSTQSTVGRSAAFGFLGKNYCYVLTVIGKDSTTAYILNEAQLNSLYATDYQDAFDNTINALSPVTGSDVPSTLTDLVRWWCDFLKSSAGAFNYAGTISENIKSCKILPVAAGAIGGTPNVPIYIGGINTGVHGFKLTDRVFTDSASVAIPWQISDWRRLEPYHEIYLYIPALGLINISPSDVIGESTLTVKVTMDVLSGDAIFVVSTPTKQVYYANTNLATDYALGSSQSSPAAAFNSLLGLAGIATGNPAAALGGALGVANSLKPHPTCIGSNSGGAILGINADQIICITVFHDTVVAPSTIDATLGSPYNGVLKLDDIFGCGYVQTMNASVAGDVNDSVRQRINELLDGGFYLEY